MSTYKKVKSAKVIKTTIISIVANVVLCSIKGIAGVVGNSYALVADAIESLTDVFTSVLVLLGAKYAQRPADDNHPLWPWQNRAIYNIYYCFIFDDICNSHCLSKYCKY